MKPIKVGIVGGAGYTAGELIRLLLHHPHAEIKFIHSTSNANRPVSQIHTDLLGDTDLIFSDTFDEDIDVLFLCMGHGASATFLQEHEVKPHIKIIDLSQDFRMASDSHDFVYGLPELNRPRIKEARHTANPGCFATCIQLGLLPLAQRQWLHDDVHINAITGSTGAGQKLSETSHFSWRNNNISVYKPFQHQHLREIRQSLHAQQSDYANQLRFIPVRGNFTRGILASIYTKVDRTLEELQEAYQSFYQDAPFVHISSFNPHLKQVVNTNKGVVYLEKHEDMVLIISMIDNLLKGASGQAVQNMNLMFGLKETAGLQLKASFF